MTSTRFLIVFVLALGFAVAGCGGGGGGGTAEGVDTSTVPPSVGDVVAGREAFISGTDPPCGTCHTLADAGTTGTIGPNLDELKPTFEQVQTAVETGPGAMPDFGNLSPLFVDNVAAYVSTVAGAGG